MEILDEKMSNVKEVVPDIIVTTNPGCHLQMKLGVEREKMQGKTKVVHLVELLAEACNIK
jgi:glycolate oxidase iron-sulfur subunit